MTDNYASWLRILAEKGGKGVVNNIDARSLGRIAEEIEWLRAAQPRYFTGCLRDGVCRGLCKTAYCPNYDLVVAARLVVEKQVEGIVYPESNPNNRQQRGY